MKKSTILLLFVSLSISLFSQWTVQSVPDPKKKGNFFVSNPDEILTESQVSYLDSIIQEVQDSSKAEIAVVMLQSIGEETPKAFATELFNHWGVGNDETDNGLLILFVMDQSRIEFETGYGTEQILSDAKCYEIQQDYMVPRFKEGDYGQGMIDGLDAVTQILMGRAEEITPSELDESYDYDPYETGSESDYSYEISFYDKYIANIEFYFFAVLGATALYILLFIISLMSKDYFVRYQTLRIFRLYIWLIVFPIPFIGLFILTRKLTEKWRNTPRISAKTGLMMHKLSEEEDNEFLKSGQIAEEKVKSVDYDVWVSGEEGDVLIQAYKRWFSKYNSCPKCKFKTYYKVYDKVIVSPTYTSSGRGEKHFKCTNCGHSKTVSYTIPKKTKSSSSSSGSSSWGGSSSSWSSSSSSSSWGGGSSGGGGAGSSW